MSPELLTCIGIACALFFSLWGASISSSLGGLYLYASPCKHTWKAAIPIVISGVLAIYGLIIATLLARSISTVDSVGGYKNLAAGISVGSACLWSGWSMTGFLANALYSETQGMVERETTSTHANLDSRMQVPLLTPTLRNRNVTDLPVPVPTLRFCMVLVFMEAIGLYGFVIALLLLAY